MADINSDGSVSFFGTPRGVFQGDSNNTANVNFYGLNSCSIATGAVGISLQIIKNSATVAHLTTEGITSWVIGADGMSITIICVDSVNYILNFVSVDETNNAFDRIERIINGQNLIPC